MKEKIAELVYSKEVLNISLGDILQDSLEIEIFKCYDFSMNVGHGVENYMEKMQYGNPFEGKRYCGQGKGDAIYTSNNSKYGQRK